MHEAYVTTKVANESANESVERRIMDCSFHNNDLYKPVAVD